MCIFSGDVANVSGTTMFARMVERGLQGLAYGMHFATQNEVAMILPLPVAPGAGDDALAFVDLRSEESMFLDLGALFVNPNLIELGYCDDFSEVLAVHTVGAFVASYVPTRADFGRLDPRFRMPDVVFDAMPGYADAGFAVFQLAPGETTSHPMAFTFPTRSPDRLFFPTVHVHDSVFHEHATFDHTLFYQHPRIRVAGSTLDGDRVSYDKITRGYSGLAEPGRYVARRELRGALRNQDTWIPAR